MLDPWIIEEIRRREREERHHREERPALEVPIDFPLPTEREDGRQRQKSDRGIAILDFSI